MIYHLHARDIELKEWIKDEVGERVDKLENFYAEIIKCRVVIEKPHRHKNEGSPYNVEIDMSVPGAELVVKHQSDQDLTVAIRDAFDAAKRKLEDFVRKQRGDIKRHNGPPHAIVTNIFQDEGYGFITTWDGREVYFHKNSVINNGFKDLKVGTEVRFSEEEGVEGPQASTVAIVKGP